MEVRELMEWRKDLMEVMKPQHKRVGEIQQVFFYFSFSLFFTGKPNGSILKMLNTAVVFYSIPEDYEIKIRIRQTLW